MTDLTTVLIVGNVGNLGTSFASFERAKEAIDRVRNEQVRIVMTIRSMAMEPPASRNRTRAEQSGNRAN